jgi:D-alanyl-D-alanine carboxypeptidase
METTEIEDPGSYTLSFEQDGQITIQADCNQATGEFALSGGNMVIEVGPATLAACPEGSQGETFLALLPGEKQFQVAETEGKQVLLVYPPAESGDYALLQFEAVESPESATGEPSAGDLPADLVAQLDAWLNSQVYSEGGYVGGAAPGLVLLVDTPEGRYLKAAGVSSLEEGTPMQVDDRLEIGSNTKSFTVVLLMQLQEEGVLSLDDPLSRWLPELAAQIPNGEEVTLYQLANHASGIPDYTGLMGLGLNDPEKLAQYYTPGELVQYAIENVPTDFAPGEGWSYNNTGYVLLGLVTETATGKSLGELYQERIFDRLGLESAILVEGSPQEGELDSQGYFQSPSSGELVNSTQWNASQGWAAGAIAMTAEDLAAYAKGLAGGELFEDPDSLAQMLTFNDAAADVLASYGLGLLQVADGYWGHEGATPAFQSLWAINPDKGTVVVGMQNSYAYSAGNFVNAINIIEGRGAQPFMDAVFYQAGEVKPETYFVMWPWTQMTDASTTTDIDAGNFLILRRDNMAKLQSATCGPIEGTFSATAPDAITFDLDASGVTCPEGDPLLQLLGMLDTVASWHYENGGLVLMLEDGTELTFRSNY